MTQPTQYFRTLSGDPPNAGVPPGVAFFHVHQPSAPTATPAASPPPPPYAMHYYSPYLDPRMFLPPQQAAQGPPPPAPPAPALLDARMFYPPLQTLQAPPAPPAPAPAPAPQQWTPPGASLLGQQAPNFEGVNYLYPQDHTVLHIIWDVHMKLDTPTTFPAFEPRLFPTGLTVAELIRRLGAPTTDDSKFGVMEVHQLGDGRWTAGTTVLLTSDLAKKTLGAIGWGETRGFAAKPVWIKVHTAT
ncbi:MAG: hypothetical protein L6R38_004588 [Xanthoria sp. 2 TBL-2021]|nr:MAG: hypothetical protein L6R38_004588 [Xanthoria sp. 2 TBL-2021]